VTHAQARLDDLKGLPRRARRGQDPLAEPEALRAAMHDDPAHARAVLLEKAGDVRGIAGGPVTTATRIVASAVPNRGAAARGSTRAGRSASVILEL